MSSARIPSPPITKGKSWNSKPEQEYYYSGEAPNQAASIRLGFIEQNKSNYDLLEYELPNLFSTVNASVGLRNWDMVMAFQDALFPFLNNRGYWNDALQINTWARQGAQQQQEQQLLARWTHARADILHQQGQYSLAISTYLESEHLFEKLGIPEEAVKSRHLRSLVIRAQGALVEAHRLNHSVIEKAKVLGMNKWVYHAYYMRALIERDRGLYSQAKSTILLALQAFQNQNNQDMMAHCFHFLGELQLFSNGPIQIAKEYLEQSLILSESVGTTRRVAATRRLLGDLERKAGHPTKAADHYSKAIKICATIGDQPQLGRIQISRALLARSQRHFDDATEILDAAHKCYAVIEDPRGLVLSSLLLAITQLQLGRLPQAVGQVIQAARAVLKFRRLSVGYLVGAFKRMPKL